MQRSRWCTRDLCDALRVKASVDKANEQLAGTDKEADAKLRKTILEDLKTIITVEFWLFKPWICEKARQI